MKKFVDIPKIMQIAEKYGCHVIMVVTNRNGGKTAGGLGWVFPRLNPESGKIALLYRTKDEIKDVIKEGTLFDNANRWHGSSYQFNGSKIEIVSRETGEPEEIGCFESIGSARAIKNKGYTGYKYFIFDESQPEDGRYLPGETLLLPSVIESMGRDNVLRNEWYLFLFSNNIENIDKYTEHFKIPPFQKHRYFLNKDTKTLKVFQIIDNDDEVDLYNIFPEYGKRAEKSKVFTHSNIGIAKREKHLFQFLTVEIRGIYLYVDIDNNGFFHLLAKNKPRTGIIYSGEVDEAGGKNMLENFPNLSKFYEAYTTGKTVTKDEKQRERCAALMNIIGLK